MDVTLSCDDHRESNTRRVDKIVKQVKEGSFAKVLQKVPAVLSERRRLRDEVVAKC
jgi:hypothetical protein